MHILWALVKLAFAVKGLILGIKIAIATFAIVILPLILKKYAFGMLSEALDYVNSLLGNTSFESVAITISGIGAWFAVQTRMVDCLAVFITAIVTRFGLEMLKIVR